MRTSFEEEFRNLIVTDSFMNDRYQDSKENINFDSIFPDSNQYFNTHQDKLNLPDNSFLHGFESPRRSSVNSMEGHSKIISRDKNVSCELTSKSKPAD